MYSFNDKKNNSIPDPSSVSGSSPLMNEKRVRNPNKITNSGLIFVQYSSLRQRKISKGGELITEVFNMQVFTPQFCNYVGFNETPIGRCDVIVL